MKQWRPVDYIVGVLVLCICYAIIMMGIAPFFDVNLSTEPKAKLTAALLSSIISVISMYIGATINKKDDE